ACICDICGKIFVFPNDLSRHKLSHLGMFTKKKRPFKCTQCGKRYVTKDNLRHHMTSHKDYFHLCISSDERPFKCDQCDATFRIEKYFNDHK
ncbi:hypothetical protein PMAYCL1PPCAC_01688, partial [Pristionchus mayeri]